MNHRARKNRRVVSFAAITLATICGCSHGDRANLSKSIRTMVAPEFERQYLLFQPSRYDRQRDWPLIIVCHGAFPDSPRRRLQAWISLAESRGFLVAAPTLESARWSWFQSADKQRARQRRDERHILSVIKHIRAGHGISADRIFIHGWSAGAAAALHTGLRHPDLFRAVVLTQPKFKDVYVADVEDRIDPYQPILVRHGAGDMLMGDAPRKCIAWLRSKQAALQDDATGTIRKDDATPAVDFIENVIRQHPWIHIRSLVTDPRRPRTVQFRLDCSFKPRRYRWSLGDGQSSSEAEPEHAYASSGVYEISVTVETSSGQSHTRRSLVHVP